MSGPSETLVSLEEQPVDRLLDFERLDNGAEAVRRSSARRRLKVAMLSWAARGLPGLRRPLSGPDALGDRLVLRGRHWPPAFAAI